MRLNLDQNRLPVTEFLQGLQDQIYRAGVELLLV